MDERHVRIFWSHVERGDGCWLWTASVASHGYGNAWDGKSVLLAHRVSWVLAHGPIPAGLCVLHRCNVRRCVRPDHLYLGTNLENARDRARAGTASWGVATGERQWNAKLTAPVVIDLRRRVAAGERTIAVAAEIGISYTHAHRIVEGRSWKHLL